MRATTSIAVLIACHNRRAKTLACLESVGKQTANARLQVVLFDDASSDGTIEAVRRLHPGAELLAGAGDAFWAGAMRAVFEHALQRDFDFFLWLNDDVVLAPDAVARLLAAHQAVRDKGARLILVGGAVIDPGTGRSAYGGVDRASRWNPLSFARRAPSPVVFRACDTLNGNVVLVPQATARAIGSIGEAYRHTLGDLDYGLRVRRAGGWVGLAPGHVGCCTPNAVRSRWFNPDLPLAERWRIVNRPLGFPLRPWLHFARQHGGPFWFLFAVLPYWRLFVPSVLARRRPERCAPLRETDESERHAPAV